MSDIFSLLKKSEIDFVELIFTDLRGVMRSKTVSVREFTLDNVKEGFGFDGSSIEGYRKIFESDMLLRPDIETGFLDPFSERTIAVICDVFDPLTGKAYERDPRYIASLAEEKLHKSKLKAISYWGPEVEFFVFDSVAAKVSAYESGFSISSAETNDSELADGFHMLPKTGYLRMAPHDKLHEYRLQLVTLLEEAGIEIEAHHHEVATGGQIEINLKYDTLKRMADKVMILKHFARNLAKQYELTAIFLPKPIYGDNGSGMHCHQSLFSGSTNLFFDKTGYAGLSKIAMGYIAGILSNLDAVLAITNPTPNSYRRLVPHFEAPTVVGFSQRNRSAAIRIPMTSLDSPKSKRIEFRCPDATTNPYLAFAVIVISGLNGIEKSLNPIKLGYGPYDENLWDKEGLKHTPRDLFESLDALRSESVIGSFIGNSLKDAYLKLKSEEAIAAGLYPTASDFVFYSEI